jgi:tetratricopeptide (TPR) repeat protein
VSTRRIPPGPPADDGVVMHSCISPEPGRILPVVDPNDFPGAEPEDLQRGQRLMDDGLCTYQEVLEALRVAKADHIRMHEALMRKGLLTPEQVRRLFPGAMPDDPPEAVEAGKNPERRAGPYICVSLLGRGGMGEVWKAWDTELARWVAVKRLIHFGLEDVARFRREARLLARLSHPNIAEIYGTSDEDDERPWLAMQLVEGRTLEGAGRLPHRAAAALIRDAARAVDHAHENGVLHRDLKPGNLMTGTDGRVFVLDFGLARPFSIGQVLSPEGVRLGTPAYMAPEQARSDAPPGDRRMDVYGLGAALYELLTGKPPFEAPTVSDLLGKVVREPPAPPRKLVSFLDRDLDAVVLKCLEKEPDRRYPSARALADDLTRFLDGEPTSVRPPATTKLLIRRNGFARRLLAVAAISGVAVAATVFATTRAPREDAAKAGLASLWGHARLVRQALAAAAEDPAKAKTAVGPLDAFIAQRPADPAGYYVRAHARRLLDDAEGAEADLRKALDLDPAHARARRLLALLQLERGGREPGIAALLAEKDVDARTPEEDVADALLRARAADDGAAALKAAHAAAPHEEYLLGLALLGGGTPEARVGILTEALGRRPHFPAALLARAACLDALGRREDALRDLDRALEVNPDSYRGLLMRAKLKGPSPAGLEDARRAVALRPRDPEGWALRALLREAAGEVEGALADAVEALKQDPRRPDLWALTAGIRLKSRDVDGAFADATMAVELDPEIGPAWAARGRARLLQGDASGAVPELDRALVMRPDDPAVLHDRGRARALKGDREGDVDDFTREIELDGRRMAARVERARAFLGMEDVDRAETDLGGVLLLEPGNAEAWSLRAEAKARRKDVAGAWADVEEALKLDPASAPALGTRGQLRLAAGDRKGAAADLEAALKGVPADADAREPLERALREARGKP